MIARFRDLPGRRPPADEVDGLIQRLLERLQYSGRVYPSNAFVDGRFVLRACIVNFSSEPDDIEALVDLPVTIGDELAAV